MTTVEVAAAGWPAELTAGHALAGELLDQVAAEQPVLTRLGGRDRLLAAAWLVSYRSARTRRAYASDYTSWLAWLADRDVDVLAAHRAHVDLWVHQQQAAGVAASTITRRLSALSGFYRHAAAADLITHSPTTGVTRPAIDPDYTATIGLNREQARALIAAADADPGRSQPRTAAVIRLLLHNALRVDEACSADIGDLGHDRGHRVLHVTRKGGKKARVPLAPATATAIDTYLTARATTAGIDTAALTGPLLATARGHRLTQAALWRLVRRLARTADIPSWAALSPHSLRHTAITAALDSGASLRDVQDYAGHRDARVTRRYDHSHDNLDRNPTYTVAAWLA